MATATQPRLVIMGFKSKMRNSPPSVQRALRQVLVRVPRAYFRYIPGGVGKSALWRLASHTWWLETDVDTTTEFNARMRVNAHDLVGRYIYYFGVWEPNLTAWLRTTLRPGDVFVDVGANIGYFSLLASKLVGESGSVVAVEAAPSTAAQLRANMVGNEATNVRVVNAAAWHEPATIDLFIDPDRIVGYATANKEWADHWGIADGHVSVPAAPLPALLSEQELARARVIKIDIEGAELAALHGLVDNLDTAPDVEIVVEVTLDLLESDGKSWEEMRDLMASHGFRPHVIENDYAAKAYWRRIAGARFIDGPIPTSGQFDVIFTRAVPA